MFFLQVYARILQVYVIRAYLLTFCSLTTEISVQLHRWRFTFQSLHLSVLSTSSESAIWKYCIECYSQSMSEANASLDRIDREILEARWENSWLVFWNKYHRGGMRCDQSELYKSGIPWATVALDSWTIAECESLLWRTCQPWHRWNEFAYITDWYRWQCRREAVWTLGSNASRIHVVSNVIILPSYFSLGRLAVGIMAEVFLVKKCFDLGIPCVSF